MTSENYNDRFEAEYNQVYKYLKRNSLTMLEIAECLNIRRANICRYLATMQTKNKAAIVQFRKCSISGNPHVGEYTTDPSSFPEDNQLYLF
jgi:hypothetical protein